MTLLIAVRYQLLALLSVLAVVERVEAADFIFGGEARRVCEAYKLICPAKKVCALQSIEWPRAMKFPVCVHDKHLVVKSNICRRAPSPGKCGAQFRRWYFNVHMGACSWFTYSGCGGNPNNFRTVEDCEKRCMGPDSVEANQRRRHRNDGRGERENSVVVEGGSNNRVSEDDDRSNRVELKPVPARAPEAIDLTTDLTASLQVGVNKNSTNSALSWEEARRQRRKEERRRRRKEEKRRRKLEEKRLKRMRRKQMKKNRRNQTNSMRRKPSRKLTPLELGPHYGRSMNDVKSPNYSELKGSPTSYSVPGGQSDESQIWLMDSRFRRRRRRMRRRHRTNNIRSRSRKPPQPTPSGATQESYYDKIKLFNILKKQEEERRNSA